MIVGIDTLITIVSGNPMVGNLRSGMRNLCRLADGAGTRLQTTAQAGQAGLQNWSAGPCRCRGAPSPLKLKPLLGVLAVAVQQFLASLDRAQCPQAHRLASDHFLHVGGPG